MKVRVYDISSISHMLMHDGVPCDKYTATVKIGIVGKYIELHDAYLSVVEALKHGGIANQAEVDIHWIDSEEITEENAKSILGNIDGMIVPGGFGIRGIEGKICAA